MTQSKSDKAVARTERLRAALRENLKRRKAQARERAGQEIGDSAGNSHDSAGFVVDKRGG